MPDDNLLYHEHNDAFIDQRAELKESSVVDQGQGGTDQMIRSSSSMFDLSDTPLLPSASFLAEAQFIQKNELERRQEGNAGDATDDEIDEVEKRVAALSDAKKSLKKMIKAWEQDFSDKYGKDPATPDKEKNRAMYMSYQDHSAAVKQGTQIIKLMYKA